MKTSKNLFLLRGIPGSGKTTLSRELNTINVEADTYFVQKSGVYKFDPTKLPDAHKWCQDYTESLMEQETTSISVSNTFTQEWEMKAYYDIAKKHGYTVFSLIVENRHGGVDTHNVPESSLNAMIDRFVIKLK
jgi:predicted kinase